MNNSGAIGIDFNFHHLAVCTIDRFGNPKKKGSYYFEQGGQNSDRNEAQLSNYLSKIVQEVSDENKPIVIEKLDFSSKRHKIKELHGKKLNHLFSSFAYIRYTELIESKCLALGVKLIKVNPAYTSIIGAFKFYGYKKYTNHELAALTIARRGLGFSERLKFHGTFEELEKILSFEELLTALISDKGTKHVGLFGVEFPSLFASILPPNKK